MRNRLIPWCLAATAFVVALSVFIWQGGPVGSTQPLQLQVFPGASLQRPTRLSPGVAVPQTSATEAQDEVPPLLILPLPPATQPALYPDVQPVPDDEPAVQDLPVERSESGSLALE